MSQQQLRRVEIIGAAIGLGAPDPRCADAPAALRAAGFAPRLRAAGVDARWRTIVRPGAAHASSPLAAVAHVGRELARHTAASSARGHLPLVLGGDHSCAIGTWKGIAQATPGPLGLIWIDAHMDAHTPATTESGKLHGMPVACLMGYGDAALTGIGDGARLDPRHVCLVGIRSFEAGEATLLQRLGVRVITMTEVRERGLESALGEARTIATNGTAGYGLSVDLDGIDPGQAPAVGSPVDGGLNAPELLAALARHAIDPALRGLEIVEYNPHLDADARTIALVPAIAAAVLSPQSAFEFARFG